MATPFALFLRNARWRKGLSQAELAHAIGYEQSHMSSLELGTKNPTEEFLERLAKELKFSDEERKEMTVEVAASKNRFSLSADVSSETFRFCSALWEKIDRLHPALISAMHSMLIATDQVTIRPQQHPERLLRRRSSKEAPM
jgi:transcriptional regulator with XRE-family HTH domain